MSGPSGPKACQNQACLDFSRLSARLLGTGGEICKNFAAQYNVQGQEDIDAEHLRRKAGRNVGCFDWLYHSFYRIILRT